MNKKTQKIKPNQTKQNPPNKQKTTTKYIIPLFLLAFDT